MYMYMELAKVTSWRFTFVIPANARQHLYNLWVDIHLYGSVQTHVTRRLAESKLPDIEIFGRNR